MKHLKSLVFFILICTSSFAQIVKPTHWSWKAEHVKDDTYKLVFTMLIDKPWHTYSQHIDGDGPRPTLFAFDKNPFIELVGTVSESGPNVKEHMDDVFGIKLKTFDDKAVFEQLVRVKRSTKITGSVESMVCNDKECLAPETKTFGIDVMLSVATKGPDTVSKKEVSTAASDTSHPAVADAVEPTDANTAGMSAYYQNFFNKAKFKDAVSGQKEEPITTWLAFILGFGGGLLALITPCVFPMIPLTVSFFIKRGEAKSKGRWESVFYGFCIMLIFFLLALPFLLFNLSSNTLNAISTNLWLNLFFFAVFIIFAFSFFGYYEIALPSSLATKVDSASNVGGLIGIFFMALTLVIVSFSCTGPLIGTLLGSLSATADGRLNLVVGMTSFGFAMGLPFTLFAFFPNLLKSLPKSGGWMDTVKKVFGFAELILAMKFLSNADLEGHWGIFKKEIFLGIWVILGAALFLYLIGVFRFKSESPTNKLSPIRIGIAGFVLVFTLYCGYGLTNHDLPLLSGFIPPNYYSIFPKKSECPDDLSCFHDYDEAIAYARKVNKPIFIDFTGYNCANCRKMEEGIWVNPDVYQRMSQKFVIVSLYVDDNRKNLPENMTYNSPVNGDKRTTYGDKWSDFQAVCFNTNTQPQYVLISPDEKRLNNPWNGYDANPKKFKDFLDHGLSAFASLSAK